jgi:hypothetical protein
MNERFALAMTYIGVASFCFVILWLVWRVA